MSVAFYPLALQLFYVLFCLITMVHGIADEGKEQHEENYSNYMDKFVH